MNKKKRVVVGMALFFMIVSLFMVQQLPAFAYDYSEGIHWDDDSCNYYFYSFNPDWQGEVNAAASTWSNCGADFTISYDSGSSYYWYSGNEWPQTYGGFTRYYYTIPDMHIYQVYSILNTFWDFDDSGNPGEDQVDVETAVLHEFGHWLHLGHSLQEPATMWDTVYLGERDVTLYFDDVLGIIDIYGP